MKQFSLLVCTVMLFASTIFAGDIMNGKKMTDNIPNDPSVMTGKFSNGLTYYIKENSEPDNRAMFQIFINAGSLDEEASQWGLAHFIEHMCFNGTKSFPKNDLIGYFESIGMEFGADLNASTWYDQTKYMIELPTDNPKTVENGILILKEWLNDVSFDPIELDKERGVILEEWRVRSGVSGRYRKQLFDYVGENSMWSERFVIGDTNVILNAPRERFTSFYNDWYRPNNAAVVAVGDFDKEDMFKLIKSKFANLKNPSPTKERIDINIPENKKLRPFIFTDKEWSSPVVFSWYTLLPELNSVTFADYRTDLERSLVSIMLSLRLQELTKEEDCPIMQGGGGPGSFIANWDAFNMTGVAKEGKTIEAIKFTAGEAFRAKQHGFTQGELDRAKKLMMSSVEQAYNERDKITNNSLADEYTQHFYEGDSYPGIPVEKELYDKFIPEISISDVNRIAKETIKTDHTILSLAANTDEKDIPNKSEFTKLFVEASKKSYEPYEDSAINKPLMAKIPTPGKIVKEEKINEIDAVKWTLSNGAEIYLKKTDFKNDQILMKSFAMGGYSNTPVSNLSTAKNAASIIASSGLGEFDDTQLSKILTGKRVGVSPYIGENNIGLNGNSNNEDLETFFQLVNMHFTAPRMDEEAFNIYKKQSYETIEAESKDPEKPFNDLLLTTLFDNHPRRQPNSMKTVKELDMKQAYNFYKSQFDGADGFKFVFVGSLDMNKMKKLVETYIASLPKGKIESPKDNKIKYATGKINETIYSGIDPKAKIFMMRTGYDTYDYDKVFKLNALSKLLSIRLREVIREDEGATYGVSSFIGIDKYPSESYQFGVSYTTNPDRLDRMIEVTKNTIEDIRNGKFDDKNVSKIKTNLKRKRESDLKKNSFWLSSIYNRVYHKQDFEIINEYPKYIEEIDKAYLTQAAKEYCGDKNNLLLIQLPEDMKK